MAQMNACSQNQTDHARRQAGAQPPGNHLPRAIQKSRSRCYIPSRHSRFPSFDGLNGSWPEPVRGKSEVFDALRRCENACLVRPRCRRHYAAPSSSRSGLVVSRRTGRPISSIEETETPALVRRPSDGCVCRSPPIAHSVGNLSCCEDLSGCLAGAIISSLPAVIVPQFLFRAQPILVCRPTLAAAGLPVQVSELGDCLRFQYLGLGTHVLLGNWRRRGRCAKCRGLRRLGLTFIRFLCWC